VAWVVVGAWRKGEEGGERLGVAVGQVAVMAVAAAAVVLPQLVRNQMVLGAFWRTGYLLSNEQTGFGLRYFAENWYLYIRTINSDGVGLMFGLGLAGMLGMVVTRKTRGAGLMLIGCCVPMLLVYMAYYWAGIMRFLLATFALYAVGGMWAVSRVCTGGRGAIAVVSVVVAVVGLWGVPEVWSGSGRTVVQRGNLARVTAELERVAQAGSVVLGEPGLLQHPDHLREWKLADPSNYRGGPLVRGMGRDPSAPSPLQVAKADLLREKYPGTTEQRRIKLAADVRKWAGEGEVFVVGSEQEIGGLGALATGGAEGACAGADRGSSGGAAAAQTGGARRTWWRRAGWAGGWAAGDGGWGAKGSCAGDSGSVCRWGGRTGGWCGRDSGSSGGRAGWVG